MSQRVYIHEFININGHNRARYQHHMTANWCPVARRDRRQLCYGVWSTVGSTGAWPQVVNMWEYEDWDALAHNFEHETAGGRDQDPALAEWWAVAASLRSGGFDRIIVAEPWTSGIEDLCAEQSTRAGAPVARVYAHELVTLPAGGAPQFLAELNELGRVALEPYARLLGAFRVASVADTEAVVLWALPTWQAWAQLERAWLHPTGELACWNERCRALGAVWHRTALVDAELSPLRIGRQPNVDDRRPLSEI
jgi:hypothetical protein